MHFLGSLFEEVLHRPIFNALVWLYGVIPYHDLGLAIIALTIVVRVALYPFSLKALQSQKRLQEIQPKIREVQERHKENREEQAKHLMELYKTERVSPFSGCLPLLIQFPILIALLRAFTKVLSADAITGLYRFVPNPHTINPVSFGVVNLGARSIPLAVLAGVLQFVQSKLSIPKAHSVSREGDMARMMNVQLLYFMPLLTVFLGVTFPAGVTLYWIVYTLFTIFQQWQMQRVLTPGNVA